MNQPTAYEQYLLELINRDRANPLAAANNYGIGLNDGLAENTITDSAKQPLVFNFLLIDAARAHSQWMLDNDIFSHTGLEGSSSTERMRDAGYEFTGSWISGENLGFRGTTGTTDPNSFVPLVHQALFESAGHRRNILNDNFREIGLATLTGDFQGYNALMVTENFARSGSDIFLTGVAFDDLVLDDDFYTVGEGLAAVEVTAVRQSDNVAFSTTTTSSGGYQFALDPGTYEVSFEQNNQTLGNAQEITIVDANVKLDLDTSNLPLQHIGEIAQISNLSHEIQTIQLNNTYRNPVIFALPLSYNGGDEAIARVTDIQDDNFSLYVQEAEYKDGWHTSESVSYLVLEAGSWELEDGTILEVGTLDTDATTDSLWSEIDFDSDFSLTPAILSQVQTNNGGEFVRTRQRTAGVEGFELALEAEEVLKSSTHERETVGWLAIESGSGSWDGLDYQVGQIGESIDHNWQTVDFAEDFAQAPNLFASISSFKGSDSAGLRYDSLGTGSVQLKVEEDQSFDLEIGHVLESVDFLAIAGSGNLSATPYMG